MHTRDWRKVLATLTPRPTLEEDRRLVEAVQQRQGRRPDWGSAILVLLLLVAALYFL